MPSTVETLTIDCADARLVADFWCRALDYRVEDADEDGIYISDPQAGGSAIFFQVVPEGKSVKNRLHLDLRPSNGMAEEVERMKELGASELRYVEEGGSYWTVMLDPEGNEFCILRGPDDGWSPDG